MSLGALLVTAFFESLAPGVRTASCTFPSASPGVPTITVTLEARPSLVDADGRFHVRLHLGDRLEVGGLAQRIDRTDARDVLIRAKASDELIYTIGLRDDGLAALNLLRVRPATSESRTETRGGACQDITALIDSWLRS